MSICPCASGVDLIINAVVNAALNMYIKQKQWAAGTNATFIGTNIEESFALLKHKLSNYGDQAVAQQNSELSSKQITVKWQNACNKHKWHNIRNKTRVGGFEVHL